MKKSFFIIYLILGLMTAGCATTHPVSVKKKVPNYENQQGKKDAIIYGSALIAFYILVITI